MKKIDKNIREIQELIVNKCKTLYNKYENDERKRGKRRKERNERILVRVDKLFENRKRIISIDESVFKWMAIILTVLAYTGDAVTFMCMKQGDSVLATLCIAGQELAISLGIMFTVYSCIYTSNKKAYLLRLLLVYVPTEILYDLAYRRGIDLSLQSPFTGYVVLAISIFIAGYVEKKICSRHLRLVAYIWLLMGMYAIQKTLSIEYGTLIVIGGLLMHSLRTKELLFSLMYILLFTKPIFGVVGSVLFLLCNKQRKKEDTVTRCVAYSVCPAVMLCVFIITHFG